MMASNSLTVVLVAVAPSSVETTRVWTPSRHTFSLNLWCPTCISVRCKARTA
jgi:hypothetical protein